MMNAGARILSRTHFRGNPFPRLLAARNQFIIGVLSAITLACAARSNLLAADPIDDPPDSQPATQPESQPATAPAKRSDSQPSTDEARPRRRGPRRGDPASGPSSSQAATSSTSTSTASSGTSSSQAAETKDKFLAVINGRIFTVTGPVIDAGTVLCKNGKIDQLGRAIQLPTECEVIDARGKWVYPGLIAAAATGIHPPSQAEDVTDVFGQGMNIAIASGITCALSGNDAVKLTFGSVDDMLVRRNVFFNLTYPRTGPERARFHAEMERVRGYLRDLARYEIDKTHDKDAKPPDKDWLKGRYEEFRKLLANESVAVQSAGSATELLELTGLAERYGFDLVIRGAHEGWIVASALGRAGCSVVMTPRTLAPPDERMNHLNGSTIENAKLLHDAGVPLAIIPASFTVSIGGLAGRDLQHLNMEAAFAVRGGLSNDDALRAITIDAARILGIDSRVGSLEPGKDADLLVCDGDILHYMTQVHYTIVNGRLAYQKSRDSLFAHIRPEGKPEIPQFDDQWPRRLEWRE